MFEADALRHGAFGLYSCPAPLNTALRDRDFAECHEWAESKRPKISFIDEIGDPLSVLFIYAVVGNCS